MRFSQGSDVLQAAEGSLLCPQAPVTLRPTRSCRAKATKVSDREGKVAGVSRPSHDLKLLFTYLENGFSSPQHIIFHFGPIYTNKAYNILTKRFKTLFDVGPIILIIIVIIKLYNYAQVTN